MSRRASPRAPGDCRNRTSTTDYRPWNRFSARSRDALYPGKAQGREKAPAALCRKVAVAKLTENPEIEIWGDGEQTRSFCYIEDCVEGIYRLMRSDFREPLNLGQDRMVTITQLADMVAKIIRITKKHVPGPMGARGRTPTTPARRSQDYALASSGYSLIGSCGISAHQAGG